MEIHANTLPKVEVEKVLQIEDMYKKGCKKIL